ncbi:hypothetical protein [Paeniglutamicibacter sp. NPDC091659]|uniref:hypothetical protein n=1 Tax=Paeniglutamicibacter sp. NPDC091659 TaxID=3364389 RepID=UPI00380A4408
MLLTAQLKALNFLAAKVPEPTIGNVPDDLTKKVNEGLGLVFFFVTAACVLGVLIVAGSMALAHRNGELGEKLKGLMGVLIACLIAGSASAIAGFFF